MSEGFLSRWSRRKRAALREGDPPEGPEVAAEPPAPPPPPLAPEAPQAVAPEAEADPAPPAFVPPGAARPDATAEAETLAEFDLSQLPPLESLTAESDFRLFLKPGVPAALRTAALRKAWVADPLIRDYRSPLDYGWDFNAAGSMPGFSLDLGEAGERLKELIRQAVGDRPAEGEQEKQGDEAGPEGEQAPAAPSDALMAEAPAAAPDTPPEAPPALPPTAVTAEAAALPPRLAPDELPAGEAESPAPRRRHGGALPT